MIIEFQTKADSNKRRLDNFRRLTKPVRFLKFLQLMDDFSIFPFKKQVRNQEQNISIKFTPSDYDLELITFFSSEIDFQEAWVQSEISFIEGQILHRVISFQHLFQSKLKSQRPKDLLDV
jgi:hypothetical protein